MTRDQVIATLRKLEKNWPSDLWLFAGSGSLMLMEKKNGERQMSGDGVDQFAEIASFNIENDGGDF